MGVTLHVTSGPAVDNKGVLTAQLTRLAGGDILFIDEIHRLGAPVEEGLYPAIEDFRVERDDGRRRLRREHRARSQAVH
jgi:Holliday junction DNA helicase RuvB